MGSGGGQSTVTDVPPEFKPAFLNLFGSGFEAARTAAGNQSPFQGAPFGAAPGGVALPQSNINLPTPGGGGLQSGGARGGKGGGGGAAQPGQLGGGFQSFAQPGGGAQLSVMPPKQTGAPPPVQQPAFASATPAAPQQGIQAPQVQKGVGPGQRDPFTGRPSGEQFKANQDPTSFTLQPSPNGGFTIVPIDQPPVPGAPVSFGSPATGVIGGEPIVGQPFGGDFIAGANPFETQSLANRAAVGEQLGGIANPILDVGVQTARGDFLSPDSNPFLRQTIESAVRPQVEFFQNQALPQLASQALNAGAFQGSSRRGLLQNQLASSTLDQIGETAGRLSFENLARERELQFRTPELLSQAAALQQFGPEIQAQVGAGFRDLQQQQIDNDLLRFQEQIEAPFRPLFPLASLIQGTNIGSTQTFTGGRPSAATRGIVGGLGGSALGAGIGSVAGLPGGAGAGAGLGGLLGLLGGLV